MRKIPVFAVLVCLLFAAHVNAQTLKVVNTASLTEGPVAPGSIVTIFGTNLTNTTASATNAADLPRTLGGVTVTVGGVQSGLYYVSPTQVNAQIDTHVNPGQLSLVLTSPTGTFTVGITVSASAPGIFSMNGSGVRDGAIIDAVTYTPTAFSVSTGNRPTYLSIYATGLDLSEKPTVRIGGIAVPVIWYGAVQPAGLQQINVQLIDALAGAGRVPVVVESKGQTSNVVEIVILPSKGQGAFPDAPENQAHNREVASLAYVPGTSLVLIADENDDVVRVADLSQKKIIRTIALPSGANPVALAADSTGKTAVVCERDRAKVAVIDLTLNTVTEVPVGKGPVAVAISSTGIAAVVNQEDNSVSVFKLGANPTVATVAVEHAPRGVAINGSIAYVTNEDSGTISIVDLASAKVTGSIDLGTAARPEAIAIVQVSTSVAMAAVADPSAGPNGSVLLVDLTSKAVTRTSANPDRTGGSSAIAVSGATLFFANQTGGSVTVAPVTLSGTTPQLTTSNLRVDLGARALAVDTKDNLLVVVNEGSGTIVLIDLTSRQVVGRIDAVRTTSTEDDDHGDREQAANMPVVQSLTPSTGKAGSTVTITIAGTNLAGATDVIFVDPSAMPGKGNGKGNGNGSQNHGPFGDRDTGFTATKITPNTAGTQITVDVQIAAGHAPGARTVRVLTPNGESTFVASAANTFTVTQ